MEKPQAALPPLNCVVFALNDVVGLVRLDTDETENKSAEVVARSFAYAGSIGVNEGKAAVVCEPGFEVAMARGAYVYAGLLGEHMKAHQLQQQTEPNITAH